MQECSLNWGPLSDPSKALDPKRRGHGPKETDSEDKHNMKCEGPYEPRKYLQPELILP